jgi:hypothetical protein
MVATKTIISNSVAKTRIKFAATAGSDTITIKLKTTITLDTTGNLTFVAGDDATGKIVRASGSWAIDFTGTTGQKFVTIASSVNNNRTFSVVGISTTTNANDTITVLERVVTEAAVAATATAYESDVAMQGQAISTPLVNISGFQYTLGNSCTVVRNSVTVANLFGSWWGMNDQGRGFGFAEQNDKDIVLTAVTSGGTVIIELSKIAGFAPVYQMRDVS